MTRTLLESKTHRATTIDSDLHRVGSPRVLRADPDDRAIAVSTLPTPQEA